MGKDKTEKEKKEKKKKKEDKPYEYKDLTGKKLCDLGKRDIKYQAEAVIDLVLPARYYCTKCARVAASEKNLCKPEFILK